jgi:hypothetical protein
MVHQILNIHCLIRKLAQLQEQDQMYDILHSHRIPVEFPRLIVICMRSRRRVGGARVRGTTNTFGLVLYVLRIFPVIVLLRTASKCPQNPVLWAT